ncbi:hypothetical protein FB45DRAFT_901410 [Roridomyces roridus]|uniref:SnoaL-like domain-containing protein n=1 Tax=Roridomyces roridus TaxID=1738132 RepID=A0AAD7C8W1_9AGAR|nr:hypothetical protein FB45DRAFT_901410 [Roridomyces roridus]
MDPESSSTRDTQLAIAHAFLDHLTINTSSVDWAALADLLAADFTHEYRPASLAPPANQRVRNKEEMLQLFELAWSGFERLEFLPPLDIIQGQDSIVFHVQSDGISKQEGKHYTNEYMLTFRFRGEKIVSVKEFVDSKYSSEFFA